ncbi:glycosyltransferase [Neorhizobium sp. P12A]|uniref:glycosyltransferase n=1 Tax=Neorhizobium sp. P12A TaxID=2268027 RepID=UPI0011F05D59|nr:glycosyltransferase [Neorhizobium sp. P12A]KAA0690242.1 glycosyltransferase [Neorhizobium sp. P12A]
MKILIASTPATGHLNPLLAIGRILMAEGHQVLVLSGSAFRGRIEGISAEFRALSFDADLDPADIHSHAPELKLIPPGPEWLRIAMERIFVDTIPAQSKSLNQVLRDFPADIIIGDDMFFGVLPMLLGPRSKRPPIVLCGTSILHWRRDDKAPHFMGLPPAITKAQREQYAAIAQEQEKLVDLPVARRANLHLAELGVGPLSAPFLDSVVELADSYMQLSVPGFEYPREIPPSVNFVGALPFIPNQAPIPLWARELDGSRKVVLVTQGTVANHDFNLLLAPTLAALAKEPDVLVVATAGGRPVEAIPGPIPANARLASYLPFEWLLPKVDVLVTNGGYGSVNQALSLGIPLVTAGLTEDKADVNARVAWSGVGIDLRSNHPTPQQLRTTIRAVLDQPNYRSNAIMMAAEFAAIDTRSEILRIVNQTANGSVGLRMDKLAIVTQTRVARRH